MYFLGISNMNIVQLLFGEYKSDIDFDTIQIVDDVAKASNFHYVTAQSESHLFEMRQHLKIRNVSVDTITGCFYSYKGQVIEESTSWPKEALALNVIPKARVSKSINGFNFGGEVLILPSNGYYHWLIEDLPVFLKTLESLEEPQILVCSNANKYVYDFLDGMKLDYIKVSRFISLSQVNMVTRGNDTGWPHPSDLNALKALIQKSHNSSQLKSKVYVSRRGSTRSPHFEEELENDLEKLGWVIVRFESMNIWDQIDLLSGAEILCGVHGAGLAGAVWMPKEAKLIELGPERHVPCFSRLSSISGLNYKLLRYEEIDYSELIEQILSF